MRPENVGATTGAEGGSVALRQRLGPLTRVAALARNPAQDLFGTERDDHDGPDRDEHHGRHDGGRAPRSFAAAFENLTLATGGSKP